MSQSRLGIALAIVLGQFLLTSCGSDDNEESDAGAQATVLAIAGFLPPVGTTINVEKSFVVTDAVVEIEAGGQRLNGSATKSNVQKFAAQVKAEDAVTVTVIEDYKTNKLILNDEVKEPDPKHSAVHGTVLEYKRKDDTWTSTLTEEGKEIKPNEQQRKKAERMGRNLLSHQSALEMYGTEPRKVGDQWKVDAANLSIFSDEDSETSGEVTLSFVKEETLDGILCAVIDGQFIVQKKAGPMNTKMTGNLKIYRSPSLMVDVSLTVSGMITSQGAPQPGMKMTSTGPFKTIFTTKVTGP